MKTALFLLEGKTRFVAWCEVEGRRRKCYVPMSTKLSRYLDPVGKEVRLELRGKRLWVEQINIGRRWVWVDAAKAPELLKRELERQEKVVEVEKAVGGYRFDLWCEGIGYEVKSVLSDRPVISYPNAESARREEQLKRLRKLVKKGVPVVWAFVVLSPSSLGVNLNTKFGKALNRARQSGVRVSCWKVAGRSLKPADVDFA